MKAVAFTHSRPITVEDALIDVDLPVPEPRGHDLLVAVKAVSVNPVDARIRHHDDPLGTYRVLGFDAAGIVRGVGSEVRHFGVGDEVYYAGVPSRPGSNAEYQLVDERIAGRKPKTLTFAQAAALPLTGLTAWEMFFERFKIPRDQSAGGNLLIMGAAGGVGSIGIQLAAELTDLTVIATVSRPETAEWCRSLGAHHVIDHSRDLAAQFASHGLAAPDYIFCISHTHAHWRELARLLAPQGSIGILEHGALLDISVLWEKCASVHFEYVFARGQQKNRDIATQHRTLEAIAHLVDTGVLRTTMTENYGPINAANLKRAHAAIETGHVHGKIVLEGFA